jgi:NADH dehydrogenase [ubiquinone] 1 alpha subcomplex assembly factor 7
VSLKDLIVRMIAVDGPMPLDRYMSLCLTHPQHGYYMQGQAIGAEGDFTTAPEISQMFGELVGAWIAAMWRACGSPDPFYLVELGPGRGVLYADMLRVLQRDPECFAAARGVLVEASPALTREQQHRLAAPKMSLTWTVGVDGVAVDAPWLVVANEFFDALPVRQLVKGPRGWHERCVGAADGTLVWGLKPDMVSPELVSPALRDAAQGAVVEIAPAREMVMRQIARHIAARGGAALIVDYGYEGPQTGETLQALARHRFAGPLDAPGDADLTAHVDFRALAETSRPLTAWGPVNQGAFLQRLGIEERAARLKKAATERQAADIDAALTRLTHGSAMGDLFKVLAVCQKDVSPPPGFVP